jgi:hypothetical protein
VTAKAEDWTHLILHTHGWHFDSLIARFNAGLRTVVLALFVMTRKGELYITQ